MKGTKMDKLLLLQNYVMTFKSDFNTVDDCINSALDVMLDYNDSNALYLLSNLNSLAFNSNTEKLLSRKDISEKVKLFLLSNKETCEQKKRGRRKKSDLSTD